MSTYRERQKREQKPRPAAAVMSCVYIILVAAIAFAVASVVMARVDLYEVLGLKGAELPLIKVPGEDIPEWALRLVLTAIIFFLLQPLFVLFTGFFTRRKREDEFNQPPPSSWRR